MEIKNKVFSLERSLYNQNNITLLDVKFLPLDIDGESPLKECENIKCERCDFSLRYAVWHTKQIIIIDSSFSSLCRAPIWYCEGVNISSSSISGVKTVRESKYITIDNCMIDSEEFAWKCDHINVKNSTINGFYAFLLCNDVTLDHVTFSGKYSFQYVNDLIIKDSTFKTKDAFWHANRVTVYDSVIEGEYLGWYSNDVTLIRCKIISHQPLCYCKNLKLIDCVMTDCDLAFEYSEVDASIIGEIGSIKNPLKGCIKADIIKEIIHDDDKYISEEGVVIETLHGISNIND